MTNRTNRTSWALLFLSVTGSLAACSSSTPSTVGAVAPADAGETVPPEEDAGETEPTETTSCSIAREQLLLPVAKVSTGEVKVLEEAAGTKTIYIDASAGGPAGVAKNARVYVDLATGAKVAVNDEDAPASTAWDLSFKRAVIFTNSGDAGSGEGGAALIRKPFASVSTADANGAKLVTESFFDDECKAILDPVGAPLTTFSEWYAYNEATHVSTPKDYTYVVRGATGKKYKLGIKAFDALPDGGSRNNQAGGFYLIQVTAL